MALFPLSSTTWTFDSLPLDEAIAKMAEIGFEGVDIPVFRQMPVDETGGAEAGSPRGGARGAGAHRVPLGRSAAHELLHPRFHGSLGHGCLFQAGD